MSLYGRFPADGFPSLITTNAANRQPVLSRAGAAPMLLAVLHEVQSEESFHIFAYVIMPDHLHLVVSTTPGRNLGRVMQLIKGRFARRYNESIAGSGNLWQSRYHERALRSERELIWAIQYVHFNPVVAQLASRPDRYRWSSAFRDREGVREQSA